MESAQPLQSPPSPRPPQADFVTTATSQSYFTWQQTPRKFTHRAGSGFAASARRAVLKATKTTKPKKNTQKRDDIAATTLRNELEDKTSGFAEQYIEYSAPLETSPPITNELLDPLLFRLQQTVDQKTPILTVPKEYFSPSSEPLNPPTSVDTQDAEEPSVSATMPPNPLIQAAFTTSKDALDLETKILIVSTLAAMEEEFKQNETDPMISWNEVADAFCGCTREDLLNWRASLESPVEAQQDSNEKVMRLLLRAFFDSQYTMLDEIVCMEKEGSMLVAKELDRERRGSVRGFLAKARTGFKVALWRYFLSESITR